MAALPPQVPIPVQPDSPVPIAIDAAAYDTVLDWIGFTILEQGAAIIAYITELKYYADIKEKHM